MQAPENDVVCVSHSAERPTSKMTPSKRCTVEGATDLRAMLKTGLEFLDPRNPSPDRRQMYVILQRAGIAAAKRAKDSRDGTSKKGHIC
jgi:hypothetical protein